MKNIILSRHDGLGSRINNIIIGIYISKKLNLPIKINWQKTDECNCELSDLFEKIKYTKFNFYCKNENKKYKLNIQTIKKIYGKFIKCRNFNDIKNIKDKNRNILLINYTNLISSKFYKKIFSKLILNSTIEKILKNFTSFNLKEYVGVHVRRGDVPNYRKIGLQIYFNWLKNHKIKKIFLCSDNDNIFCKFKSNFDVIRYHHRSLNRNSSEGIQDALINIILLSKCKIIISGDSQFSKCASSIGNIKYVKLNKLKNNSNKSFSEKLDNTNSVCIKDEKLDNTNYIYMKDEKIYNNDNNTLFIYKRDGLGSRLLNILVGIYYSNTFKLNYKIIWIKKNNCCCEFKDLFKNKGHFEINIDNFKGFIKKNNFISMENFQKTKNYFDDNNDKDELPVLRKIGSLNINNKILSSIFNTLKLSDEVKKILQSFKEELDNIVGVHVRRGDLIDHKEKIQRNRIVPNFKYFNYLDKKNIKKIFLCSDSESVFDDFKKKYKIIKFESKVLNRDTKIGIQYSLVDIILLSRCKYIIGGRSGFSQIASIVGNKKLIRLK